MNDNQYRLVRRPQLVNGDVRVDAPSQVCDARAYKLELWGCSSVGERLLCKQEVTGSNPVSSTRRRRAAIGDSVSYPLMEEG